jgi:hypothetical protein
MPQKTKVSSWHHSNKKRLKAREPSTKQKGKESNSSKENRRREVSSQRDASKVGLPRQPIAAEAVSGKQGPQL